MSMYFMALDFPQSHFGSMSQSKKDMSLRENDKNATATLQVKDKLLKQAYAIRNRWRKLVTGHSDKRVRDYATEKQSHPKIFKLIDKIGFTFGVLNIVACQYFLLNIPEYFPLWYVIVIPTILLTRFFHFKSQHWHYFMMDFCYFGITLSLLNVLLFRMSPTFFKVCFILCTGCLPIAIPVWRNSFIFHDFDKITSVYIHILPCMLYHTLRWRNTGSHSSTPTQHLCLESPCESLNSWDYGFALCAYITWQVLYLVITEVIDRDKFDAHPELVTSLRWLSSDTKNPFGRMVLRLLRKWKLFGHAEEFDAHSIKTKLVFVSAQLILMVVSVIPTPLLYYSSTASLLYIALVFTVAVYNGASFYIEVFSQRYAVTVHQLEDMHQLAAEAQSTAQGLLTLSKNSQQALSPSRNRSTSSIGSLSLGSESIDMQTDLTEMVDASHALLQTSEEVWKALKKETACLQRMPFS